MAVPAEFFQELTVCRDHVVEATNIGFHVLAVADDGADVILDVSCRPLPTLGRTAKCHHVAKVGVILGELFELFAIVDVLLESSPIDEPELVSLVARIVGQQPVNHSAKRCDAGAGCDEDGVLAFRLKNEMTMRAVEVNVMAGLQVAQVVGHKSFADPVQAKVEPITGGRRRRQGVCPSDGLAILARFAHRDELSCDEIEFRLALYFEFQMLGSIRKDFGPGQTCC